MHSTRTKRPQARWGRAAALPYHLRALALFAGCLLLCGCSMVSGTRHADGRLVVTSWRFLWKSEAIRFTAHDTNFVAVLSIGKSASDDASVAAVTEGITRAVLKTAVPLP